MLGFLCADPLFSTPPPLSPSVPEAPSLILPSVRFQSNDEAGCVWKYWIAKTSLGERVCEWTFQHRARPGPCATDWWTTNGILCPERERGRKRGQRVEREKKIDTEKGGGGSWGFLELFSLGPYIQVWNTLSHDLSDLWPPLSECCQAPSNREHKTSQPQRPPFTPHAALTQR